MPGSETTENGLAGAKRAKSRQLYGLKTARLWWVKSHLMRRAAMQGTAQLSMPRNARPARGAGADSWNWYTPG